jgi:hypothetical protein
MQVSINTPRTAISYEVSFLKGLYKNTASKINLKWR